MLNRLVGMFSDNVDKPPVQVKQAALAEQLAGRALSAKARDEINAAHMEALLWAQQVSDV